MSWGDNEGMQKRRRREYKRERELTVCKWMENKTTR